MNIVKQAEAFKIAVKNFSKEDLEQLEQILSTPDKYTLLNFPDDFLRNVEELKEKEAK